MKGRSQAIVRAVVVAGLLLGCSCAQSAPQITQLLPAQLWQRLEFSVTNVPAATNPFDPNVIALDATFTLPSGRAMVVPGFWYQNYQRGSSGGYEYVTPIGLPEWRIRFTPPEAGTYALSLAIRTNGQSSGAPATASFTVPATSPPAQAGYVRVAASRQYFETGDGQGLRLIGENVDWYTTGQGTYQYDTWFPDLQAAGENYVRLMMTPWAFGLETDTNSLTNYRLDSAWKLDYVVQLAEQRGLYFLLSLDVHLMFQPVPDYWGNDNYWQSNPYNATNGGPCLNQDGFFTNTTAQVIYQKRLRYLVARYGYSPKLLAWQLLSEIDNEYAYLTPTNVPPWHNLMAGWLHTNDPFGHLVTTSLTGGSDRPEIWTLPQLDFAAYHSYGEPSPATRLNTVAQSFLQRYGKPVLIDEFGTDWRGWNRTNDLYLRGFRQGLWGGALGGSVGTAMSWWWDSIDSENDYAFYPALGTVLNRTGWGRGVWTNIAFQTAGSPPSTVDSPVPGGQPLNVQLPLDGGWGTMTPGQLAVPGPQAAWYSAAALNSFVHGIWHADLKTPFHLNAWLTNNARIVLHLNSVSDGSIMVVRVDGTELFRTNLPNLDGGYTLNEEYNLDIPVNLPSGNHFIDVTNAGTDWFFLDWVRLEQVLPASYAGNWQPSPDAIGVRGTYESLLYVVAPGVAFPANGTNAALPVQHASTITLTNWLAGAFVAEWYSPTNGLSLGLTLTNTVNGKLTLPLPDFTEDLAAILYPPPSLTPSGFAGTNAFQFLLTSETGGRYLIQKSSDLMTWTPFLQVTNTTGSLLLSAPYSRIDPPSFFRAAKLN
jgi:hypothetical protein